MVTGTKFTYMPVDIPWLHIRSSQTFLWILCGYRYEVYIHACVYSVVTYTKLTHLPVDILWLQIRSLHTCLWIIRSLLTRLWIFCGYVTKFTYMSVDILVTYTKFTDMPVDTPWLRNEVYIHACGYSVVTHTKFRHACGYFVVTYTKFTDCMWIFYGYTYMKHLKMPVENVWLHGNYFIEHLRILSDEWM